MYLDESGNTGETLFINNDFNFKDQPIYVLTGIIITPQKDKVVKEFIENLKTKYKVNNLELKAKTLYSTKRGLIIDLVDFLVQNEIPIFTELMDKKYYLNIQLVEHILLPSYSFDLSDELIQQKQFIVSNISQFLNPDFYQKFIRTIKDYTNDSLEHFYRYLIDYFDSLNSDEGEILKNSVEQTMADYYSSKKNDELSALRKFLPLPDLNPHSRLIHLLPNFNAFTNLVARAENFRVDKSLPPLSLVHDEQKQFDVIFKAALEEMKTSDISEIINGTKIQKTSTYKISSNTELIFRESKIDVFLQVADLIAGFTMRFWIDFIKTNYSITDAYIPSISKLIYPNQNSSEGINFVVPDFDHYRLMNYSSIRNSDI